MLRRDELVKGVSAGEVVVDTVSVKVMVVMMTVHCHRGARQYKRKYSRSDQPEFRHDRSPFRADVKAPFTIPNKMRVRNIKRALSGSQQTSTARRGAQTFDHLVGAAAQQARFQYR